MYERSFSFYDKEETFYSKQFGLLNKRSTADTFAEKNKSKLRKGVLIRLSACCLICVNHLNPLIMKKY